MNRRQVLAALIAVPVVGALVRRLQPEVAGDFSTETLRYKMTERYSQQLELKEVLVEIQQRGPKQTQVLPTHLADPNAWYIKTSHSDGLRTYKRVQRG